MEDPFHICHRPGTCVSVVNTCSIFIWEDLFLLKPKLLAYFKTLLVSYKAGCSNYTCWDQNMDFSWYMHRKRTSKMACVQQSASGWIMYRPRHDSNNSACRKDRLWLYGAPHNNNNAKSQHRHLLQPIALCLGQARISQPQQRGKCVLTRGTCVITGRHHQRPQYRSTCVTPGPSSLHPSKIAHPMPIKWGTENRYHHRP